VISFEEVVSLEELMAELPPQRRAHILPKYTRLAYLYLYYLLNLEENHQL
jgi:hypothetical protein